MNCWSPGIGILKSWQGIVEIVLRGVLLLLTLIMAGSGGGVQSAVDSFGDVGNNQMTLALTDAAGGWLIFMAFVIIVYEIFFIVQRFINIKIINDHIMIVIIVDVVFNFVCAVLIFCAAVALATYIPQVQQVLDFSRTSPGFQGFTPTLERILAAGVAATIVSFLNIIVLVALGIFMILGGLILKWGATNAKYDIGSGASGAV